MHKKERVDAALRGDQVDRIPASMWGHDFEREWGAQSLAEAMVENFTRYDWDFMKVNPRASYHVEGWGVKVRPSGEKYLAPIFEDTPIKSSSDWKRIRPLEADRGVLGEQLRTETVFQEAGLARDRGAVHRANEMADQRAGNPGIEHDRHLAGLDLARIGACDRAFACLAADAFGRREIGRM